jgi:hypothetical protein
MKPLNVRFDKTVFDNLDLLSEKTTESKSDIARAAMQIGLKHLLALDSRKLTGSIHIAKLRIMFNGDQEVVEEILEQTFNSGK